MLRVKHAHKLWFDVGIKRYTTFGYAGSADALLWFDVGIKRYTTTGLKGVNVR